MTTAKQLYRFQKSDSLFPWCWLCGRDESDRPSWWHAEWWIDRAHIVRVPRTEDIRACILLCRLCHKIQHGERFAALGDMPRITVANMLWLKRRFDFYNYDRRFLDRHSLKRLPRPAQPPAIYRGEYARRHAA